MPGGPDEFSPTVIAALPYSDGSPVTLYSDEVWYQFTPYADLFLSLHSTKDGTINYAPQLEVHYGTPGALLDYMGGFYALGDRSCVVPCLQGVALYIRIVGVVNSGATSGTLGITASLLPPGQNFVAGSLFINDDTAWEYPDGGGLFVAHPASILSPSDGSVVRMVRGIGAGESGDALSSGILLLDDAYDKATLHLYDSLDNFALIADVASQVPAQTLTHHITRRDATSFFVSAQDGSTAKLWVVSDAGISSALQSLPATHTVFAIGASSTGIVYYASGAANTPIRRWDANGNAPLSDLSAGNGADYLVKRDCICVLADDTILVGYRKTVGGTVNVIKHYSAAGATLHTYTLSSTGYTLDRVARSLNDPNTFWVWLQYAADGVLNNQVSDFLEITVSSGSAATSIIKAYQVNAGVGASGILTGHSFSCPLIALPLAYEGPARPPGVLGPLAWLELTRYIAPGSAESPLRVHFYSDHDMQCPGLWYGGFKEGRVTRWSDAVRTMSDIWTGDWQGSTFSVGISDYDLSIRQRLASPIDRFWSLPCVCRMTTRENRAALGIPYIVFVGPIVDAQPIRPLGWDITLGDSVSYGLLSNQQMLPWRQIRDGFLSQLDEVATALDPDTPEPIIYGEHLRVPDIDPPSPQGFVYAPTYLGIQTIPFGPCHVWLVAGHACADILDVYYDNGADPITSVIADEGTDWLVPHYAGWAGEFLDPNFIDLESDTYATFRRYTLIYGLVGQTNPDNCAAGAGWAGPPGGPAPAASYTLLVAVQGVEPVGDGTGAVILDRFQQYTHFLINFIAYKGIASYQLYTWLTNPNWDLFDGFVPLVDEDSFDVATAIGELRLPSVGSPPSTAGYIGAAIIGARAGHRKSVREWIADWNRSCGCRFGITNEGQMRIAVLHPTQDIKDAAPLFTDGYEILDQSFQVDVRWGDHANAIPFKADFEHATGQWKTLDVVVDYVSTGLYGQMYTAETREYPFAPGLTMASHLAGLELRLRADPPRQITLSTNVDDPGGLGTLELGDYFRYIDYATVAESPAGERIAQVQSLTINPGTRQVTVGAIDCEEHLGYDTET